MGHRIDYRPSSWRLSCSGISFCVSCAGFAIPNHFVGVVGNGALCVAGEIFWDFID